MIIRDKYLKRVFTYEGKCIIADYIVTLRNRTTYCPYEVELSVCSQHAYRVLLNENFETIEEAIKRFFDICEHIEDYVKEEIDG